MIHSLEKKNQREKKIQKKVKKISSRVEQSSSHSIPSTTIHPLKFFICFFRDKIFFLLYALVFFYFYNSEA